MKLPKRGIKVEDLKCKECQKTVKECAPKDCENPKCPYKKEPLKEAEQENKDV